MPKLNSKEICQPLLEHARTVLSAGLEAPFDDYAVDYGHDGFSIFRNRKSGYKRQPYTILNAYILPCKNGNFLKVGMDGTVDDYKNLYSTLFKEPVVDKDYLESVIQKFFDVGLRWNQFDSVEYHPKDLSISSLTTDDDHRRKSTTKKHLAMFYYSARSRKAEQRRRFNGRKNKTAYSICTMSLNLSTHTGKLAPVYVLNIPLLADIKFPIMVDANTGISDEDIQLLIYKYERCIRFQLYDIIKQNLRLKGHETLGEVTDYSMQQLVDYVTVTEMASY